MFTVFNETMSQKITSILADMINPVKILFFKDDSDKSLEAEEFLSEFVKFSSKITLIERTEKPKFYPAIFVTTDDESLEGVGFYGTPAGYEINSFLSALLEVSGKSPKQKIITQKNIELYAIISLTCDRCPKVVTAIHSLAIQNPNIKSYMVEESLAENLIQKNDITAFPTIICDDQKFTDVDDLISWLTK